MNRAQLVARIVALEKALTAIRDARDHCAEQGNYPAPPDGPNEAEQCFDDWAADIASAALESKP